MALPEFKMFTKIPRFNRAVSVLEKIDGSNALVYVGEDGSVLAGKRTGWITPENDNHGFATWVRDNEEELRKLGPGKHWGEWWGHKINRGYGLKEKKFSLFNVARWSDTNSTLERPVCCHVVPVLRAGNLEDLNIREIMASLWESGSIAAPGYNNPEGIVIYHHAAGVYFKKTFGGDGHKGG